MRFGGGGNIKVFSIAVFLIIPNFYPQIEELFLRFSVLVRKHLKTGIVLLCSQIMNGISMITPCSNYLLGMTKAGFIWINFMNRLLVCIHIMN